MNRTMRRLAIIFAAVCVLMIMAVPAFAATGNGWYKPGTPTTYTNPIKVKVVLQSRQNLTTPSDYVNCIQDVTLGTTNMSATSFTVLDALIAFNSQQTAYEALEDSGAYIQSTDSVLYNIRKVSSGNIYGPVLYTTSHYPLDGWMFKVNGKFPTSTQSSTNASGLDIKHTYIKDGDVIYFFTDYPWQINGTTQSAYFVSAHTSYSYGVLSITLKQNQHYYSGSGSSATWTIGQYDNYTPSTNYQATVVDENGNTVGSTTLTSGTGYLSCSLSSGTNYYVSVTGFRDWHSISGIDYYGSSITVDHLERTIAYDKVNH